MNPKKQRADHPKERSVLILGAGLGGLTLAHALKAKGIHCVVLEPAREPGGVIRSDRVGGCLFEKGPTSLQIKSRRVEDFLNSLASSGKMQEANSAASKRFIVKDGHPVALPMSLMGGITTPVYRLRDKLRLLREPFVRPSGKRDESLESFATRRMGRAFCDYGVSVLASGIYAGDPAKLSVRHAFPKVWNLEANYGSLIRGAIRLRRERKRRGEVPFKARLVSYEGGLETLTHGLAEELGEIVSLRALPLRIRQVGRRWNVAWTGIDGSGEHTFTDIVATLPVHDWTALPVDDKVRNLFHSLPTLPYAPLTVLGVAYKKEAVGHPLDGFGMLVPLVEKRRILGAIFNSSLFPGRAPGDLATFNVFIGGATMPRLATQPDYALHEILHHELSALLGITETPVLIRRYDWAKAIPQYNVGHDFFLDALKRVERDLPGFIALGNIRGGPGLSDRVERALELADQLAG